MCTVTTVIEIWNTLQWLLEREIIKHYKLNPYDYNLYLGNHIYCVKSRKGGIFEYRCPFSPKVIKERGVK